MSEALVVRTVEGPVRGTRREDGSIAFLGIPFAAPPTGARRFQPPQPVKPWTDVRDATEYGATPQRRPEPNALIPEPSVPGSSTLNVNVFTPAADAAARPVLVWIHGGGYSAGSPASPWYDGRAYNRDGVVTVTVSYRLGFDGFGIVPGAPANRGVRDWMAALEWVQRNIAAFGGDPGRVTIAGQSAGGGAVLTLLGMPKAQHLFHAAIANSAALGDIPHDLAERRSIRLAALAGVEPTAEGYRSASERDFTRRQYEASLLGKRRLAATTAALHDGLPWGPVVDGELIEQPTVRSIAAGIGADKPLLLGATDDEFTMMLDAEAPRALRFVPAMVALRLIATDRRRARAWFTANRRRSTAALLGRYVSDRVFRSLVVRVAEARGPAPTWVYRFAWVSPVMGWSCHCLDVPFWFDCLDEPHVASIAGDDPPQGLADEMHGAAVAFVTEHEPGWPTWRSDPGTTRVFGDSPAISNAAYDDALPLA
ncbi:carboxylesterase/lipase family protein [Microbacterium sp.]|uniref:carboxylesterase/lipase family protein n=1 Tax=Microbacterium sp. TaxID=51671 RepID=UPI0028116E63|nr:carboxylesterase family protein [Microbacterium sp.]